jgi:pimeloyl-ACP methyl ester esterase
MHYLESPRGIQWHYDCEGDGPVLLFLHGWGVDHRIWRQQFKYFSKDYRVISIDLPGHGKTTWQPVTLHDIADEILRVLDHLGLSSFSVVASSFGGLVALKLVGLTPGRLSSMVFAGSQAKFVRDDDYPYGLDVSRLYKLADQLNNDYPTIVNIFFRSLFTKQERASRRYKWIQTFRRTDGVPEKDALLGYLEILKDTDLRHVLHNLVLPVQFINGTEDYICPPSLYHELKDKLGQARFDWLPECGHFPFLIEPHTFNKKLEEFLIDKCIRA